jgi:protein SCO1/2
MNRRKTLKAILLASVGGLLTACSPRFHGADITGAQRAAAFPFPLTDMNGQPRTLADFKGKVVVLFFGYTQCPSVCPTTLSTMLQVKGLLGADGDKLQVLFVSVDPERDTPEALRAYMTAFDPGFLGLFAGSPEKLTELTREFNIYFKKIEGQTPSSYTIDHSAFSYVYDPQGRLRLKSSYDTPASAVAEDIKLLLGGA